MIEFRTKNWSTRGWGEWKPLPVGDDPHRKAVALLLSNRGDRQLTVRQGFHKAQYRLRRD